MSITVTSRKMPITDALRQYAEEKVGNALKAIDADPISCEVVLMKEKNPANPLPSICEVTVRIKGHIVRVEENEEDMYAAIDVAAAKIAPDPQVQDPHHRQEGARHREDRRLRA